MKKRLLLVRHAKAESEAHNQNDFERELTSTGLSQSYEMGKILAAENISSQLIISSPSYRTKSTGETLAQLTGYNIDKIVYEESAYNGSARSLMEIINHVNESVENIMLIGHNPGISYLAEFLTQDNIGDLPTCGIVNVEFDQINWNEMGAGTGKLIWFKHPL